MLKVAVQKVTEYFRKKKMAYVQVFNRENVFTNEVLRDLARFCRAHTTTFNRDPHIHALLEGRREVWLRIQTHLQLSEQELYEIHSVKDKE